MGDGKARGIPPNQWLSLKDRALWELFESQAEDVVEFRTELVPGFTDVGGLAAFLVTGVDRGGDGGLLLSGRVIGCDHEGVGKELSSLVNRKGYRLHLCPASPCAGGLEDSLVHTVSVRWFEGAGADAPYMRPWGRLVLKKYL